MGGERKKCTLFRLTSILDIGSLEKRISKSGVVTQIFVNGSDNCLG